MREIPQQMARCNPVIGSSVWAAHTLWLRRIAKVVADYAKTFGMRVLIWGES